MTTNVQPHRNGTVPVMAKQGKQQQKAVTEARPTAADIQGDGYFAEFARKTWLETKRAPKPNNKVLKEELWDKLEKGGFAYTDLLVLETLQALEKYLWPGYSDASSNHHVMLLAILVNVKKREKLSCWSAFGDRPADFSSFFRRALSMSVDLSISLKLRTHLLCFIIGAFESLDNGLVRKECAPLVGIAIWQNLHGEAAREDKFNKNVMLRKMWRSSTKRYDTAEDEVKARLRFERSWLYTLLMDFLNRLYAIEGGEAGRDNVIYCERFNELLMDLLSQLPTRRFVASLLENLNLLPAMILSPLYNDEVNGLFRDMCHLLRHYCTFPIDDQTGMQMSTLEHHEGHHLRLAKLQRVAFKSFPQKLKILALSNYGSLSSRSDLAGHLESLDQDELLRLCDLLGFRTEYPASSNMVRDRGFFLEVLIQAHEAHPTFQESVRELSVVPTEQSLYNTAYLRNEAYNGSRPLAIPKLNLQYLTMGDFLWRSFILHRAESFYAIRKDVEDVIKRVKPRLVGGGTRFDGQSRMALPIPRPAILDVGPANVGDVYPSHVRAELTLDVWRLQYNVRKEWDSLRPGDAIFIAAIVPYAEASNGFMEPGPSDKIGLRHLRAAEVLMVQDENGKAVRDSRGEHEERRPKTRRLIIKIDPASYEEDRARMASSKVDIYNAMNMVIRRRGRENNFRSILESIKMLTLSDVPAPSWLQGVFLGYDDPAAATYKRLSTRLKSIDFRDTFLDWQHLIESLPGKILEPSDDMNGSFPPPYVLETVAAEQEFAEPRPPKKRRKAADHEPELEIEAVKVSTYKPPNMGPYLQDAPKLNTVRFTPTQIEAINSGTQPGLSLIVGPPGTGKTDVAVQIINNIYHNFPGQRTLLVAHSNQALNQLFQKIMALDIDERHLLRLGHGEEELETDASFSKYGRVESFLERGTGYLAEVNRLAANLQAPGAHGNSCETADYFNQVYVKPTWAKYWDLVKNPETTVKVMLEKFPFYQYFSNASSGAIFPQDEDRDAIMDVIQGCYRHIEKIFTELEDIRPFEVLRREKDKANYLLIKEARVIAMTSTHAAMRRQEIADLGFHYDNVIMEEAAQVTEIESFIPLALQKPKDGNLPLQRVVLIGDHLQNSPVVQSLAFRQYANLEQSLFLRLVRLGVPTITLDQQGRARPSIAQLYSWRYPRLNSLPAVTSKAEFLHANAGLRYEYQFIDVHDYKGKGETEPTPHFIQNLGEAEYAVALFMYMRLLGYPANKISILAMYSGQKGLIKDVLDHRCKGNRLFGMPKLVTTVDKYQGEQNDYIILSLTRTLRPGYLRDVRRLTVALSRSRLGLYILGRKAVFESCYEVQEAFKLLFERPTTLQVVPGEMFPTSRLLEDEVKATEMTGVEHLGQYVHEMTRAKVQALKEQGAIVPMEPVEEMRMDEDEEGDVIDEDVPDAPGLEADGEEVV